MKDICTILDSQLSLDGYLILASSFNLKQKMSYVWKQFGLVVLFQLGVCFVTVMGQSDMCGLSAADPTKTCVSIRLPWNPTPMYFCVEKNKFRYRNQCQNRLMNQCGVNTARQDILLVQDSWSCCPLVSYPDSCVNQQCPPSPLGRKCQTIEPNANSANPCCDSYFCEDGMTPETCQFKRLEQTCNAIPQGKTNCIAFVDPYGCCPKYQCDGEGKPGQCPAEVQAAQWMSKFNVSTTGNLMMGAPAGGGMTANFIMGLGGGNAQNRIPCIGDSNCPGSMKCCSNDMNVYMKEISIFIYRNKNPTNGYCLEPQQMSGTNTKAIKYVSQ